MKSGSGFIYASTGRKQNKNRTERANKKHEFQQRMSGRPGNFSGIVRYFADGDSRGHRRLRSRRLESRTYSGMRLLFHDELCDQPFERTKRRIFGDHRQTFSSRVNIDVFYFSPSRTVRTVRDIAQDPVVDVLRRTIAFRSERDFQVRGVLA